MRPAVVPGDARADRRTLWRRWLVYVATGELLGFAAPALAGVWVHEMGGVRQVPALMAAGLVEGAALGLAMALVLRRELPGFRTAAWVVATSVGAALAWLLGMLPSTAYDVWSAWPAGLAALAAAALGTLLLLSIGTAQALVLPRRTPRRLAWVGWTALAWCAGLTVFTAVASPLWHEGQARSVTVLIGVVGGAAMALTMAAITGVGMLRLRSGASIGSGVGGSALVRD